MKNNKLNLLALVLALTSCNIDNAVSEAIESINNNESIESQAKEESSSISESKEEKSESEKESSESSSIETHTCTYPDSNDYIRYQKCSVCGEYGKNKPTNEFLEVFSYSYDSSYKTKEEELYDEIDKLIESASTSEDLNALNKTVEDKLDELEELIDYFCKQYQCSQVMSYKYNTDTWNDAFEEIYSLYSKSCNEYNVLLNHIFYSSLKEIFYEGEDLDEVEKELKKFEDTTISELETKINELENKAYYEDLEKTTLFRNDVEELISLRNQLAKIYGYDNYYDYAYAEVYGREYDSTMISNYKSYIKKYFPSKYIEVVTNFSSYYDSIISVANTYLYNQCFDNVNALNRIANYFKTMTSEKYNINMYDTINNAFKEGRVFIGEEDGKSAGFSNDYGNDGNYMFFANEYYYAGSTCLVHESGHYMCDYANYPISDFDLFETHSQSNEMFYLNYLSSIMGTKKYKYLEIFEAYDVIDMALSSAIIDEVEECLYKNYCSLDASFKDGISSDEYDLLVETIANSYSPYVDVDNWKYYFTQSSCYEISYGISLLPCYGLYFDIKENEEKAKEKYFKTLTFYKNDDYNKENTTYLDVLDYAGYYSPFDEDLFKLIANKA